MAGCEALSATWIMQGALWPKGTQTEKALAPTSVSSDPTATAATRTPRRTWPGGAWKSFLLKPGERAVPGAAARCPPLARAWINWIGKPSNIPRSSSS